MAKYPRHVALATTKLLESGTLTTLLLGDQAAAYFKVSKRVLMRRLKAEGSSFNELASASRFREAKKLLEGSTLPTVRIADLLGISTRSLDRLFMRHLDMTVYVYRKKGGR